MNKQLTARGAALEVLTAVAERQAYSNLMLNSVLEKGDLSPQDARLATELVYGTIQRQYTLDWILENLVKKGLQSLEPWVVQLLRLSLYQLRFLDKVPNHAAVNEAVRLAKQRGHKGIAGLVNGVLRNYLRQQHKWRLPENPKTVKDLALVTSHPEWMVRRFQKSYGVENARALLQANNQVPPLTLRSNSLRISSQELLEALKKEYPTSKLKKSLLSEQGVIMQGGGNPITSNLYREGFFTFQDESSMLVSEVVDPQPGQRGLDACAAPGGKTTHLAEKMNNQGTLLACDLYAHKVRLIQQNATRLGLTMIEAFQADARQLSQSLTTEPFDFVLLDAPCSGLGVIRRKPEIKWRKEGEIEPLLSLQRQLLESVSSLVRLGGTLVYSTCTMNPRENEEQVAAFLAAHPSFRLDSEIEARLPEPVRRKGIVREGMVQLLPHHFNSDGFFIARMIKVA